MRLDELIKKTEGKTLEFKQDISSPLPILKTMVAFANTSGGTIVIGIEDKSRAIKGVVNPLAQEERLTNLVADNIYPKLVPNIELVNWKNKQLLRIEVYSSPILPHYLTKHGEEKGVYVRLGSSNRQAGKEIIAELKRIAERQSFDEMPMPKYSLENLDFEAIKEQFSNKINLRKRDLKSLKITDCYQKKVVPTIGGMLLFGKNRTKLFPEAYIQCARFRGNEKGDITDQLEIDKHLPIAAEDSVEFLKKHALLEAKIESIRREDRWSIPLKAIREGIINAIVHRDYSLTGMPIKIARFDDRIEIINPGLLMNGITIEDIHEGVSKIRNRVIARTFKELGLIEQWGTGFRKMQTACAEYMLPGPMIEEIGGPCVRLTIFTETLKEFSEITNITNADKSLLKMLRNSKDLSSKELSEKLNVTTRTIRSRVNKLARMGLLTSISRGLHDPQRKYVLSKKGGRLIFSK